MIKKILIVINYKNEILFDYTKYESAFDFLFMQEKKWIQFSQKLVKYLTKNINNYKQIILFGSAGTFKQEKLWELFIIDRTFLFENKIIDNQKVRFFSNTIDNLKIEKTITVFNPQNIDDKYSFFWNLVDMESFFVANISNLFSTQFFIIKWATDLISKTINNEKTYNSDKFKENLLHINVKFENILDKIIDFWFENILNSWENFNKIPKIINAWNEWEMFFENPKYDYINTNKKTINLIKWIKKWSFLRDVPKNYSPKWTIWFALLRWFNCIWKCTYCYLQSYFKNPDMVQFFNTDDLIFEIKKTLDTTIKKYWNKKNIILYDWDFYDSFWFIDEKKNIEQIIKILELLKKYPNVKLELRTKFVKKNNSDFFSFLWEYKENLIFAITFSPENIIKKYENWTENYDNRFIFAKKISNMWIKIWIRIDPFIRDERDISQSFLFYKKLTNDLNKNFEEKNIENIEIWVLRIKKTLYKKLKKFNQQICNNLIEDWSFFWYEKKYRKKIYSFFEQNLSKFKLYISMD